MLIDFCSANEVPFELCGKVVVAKIKMNWEDCASYTTEVEKWTRWFRNFKCRAITRD